MFLLLLSLLLPVTGHASTSDSPADSVVVLPEITVTATRTPAEVSKAPARVTVLDREDFLASGSDNLAQLLASRSSGFIRHYGNGGLATLSLRGASPGQTLLLVDGHRLSDPQTGQFDLSLLPTVLLEDVEIIHGAGSALFGSDGVAGVINLRTAAPGATPSYAFRADAGAFGSRGISARARAGVGGWNLGVASEFRRATGDFPVDEPFSRFGQARRAGADRQQASIFATAARAGDHHALKISSWLATAERGLPGPVTSRPSGERQWDDQFRIWASEEFTSGANAWSLSGGTHLARLRYFNPQLETDDMGTSTTYFLEGTLTRSVREFQWTGGVSADLNRASHPARRDAAVWHSAAFGAAAIHAGRLTMYPALRADAYVADSFDPRAALSPRLGASFSVFDGDFAVFKASAGRTFRAPTMNERFWQPGGDPDLLPEHGWHADAGIRTETRRVSTEVSAFASALEDEIVWVRSAAGHYAAENLRKTRSLGLELSGTFNAPLGRRRHVNGGTMVTLTRASDRSDPDDASFGAQLRYVPVVQIKSNLSMHAGPFSLDFESRYASRRFVTTDGTQWVDPYFVADFQLRFRTRIAGVSTTLALAVENVLDASYAIIQHYPMPPRHLRFTLNISDLP